jgi:hypothetical protein
MTRFVALFRGVQCSDARTFLGFPKGKRTNAERKYFFTKESSKRNRAGLARSVPPYGMGPVRFAARLLRPERHATLAGHSGMPSSA